MRFLVLISTIAATYAAGHQSLHATRARNGGKAINGKAAASEAVKLGEMIVLFEVGGVPGNECLTFRNNGQSKPLLDLIDLLITPQRRDC